MSDATLYQVGIVEETTYGTMPTAAFQRVNVTEFPLTRDRTSERPNILTGNRRRFPKRALQEDGGLSLPAPIQFGNMLLPREGLLGNDIGSAVTITGSDIDFNGTTGAVTAVSTSLADVDNGDWLYITGTASNNGWKGPVTGAAALTFNLPAAQVTTEVAGSAFTFKTQRHTDAALEKSYSSEWQDTGLTNKFRANNGNFITQGVFAWAQGAYATETYTLIGKAPVKGSATVGTGAALAAPTSSFMNSVQDFGTIRIGGTATSAVISTLNLTVTNTNNVIRGLGSLGPAAFKYGPMDIDLTATVLYDDNSDVLLGNQEDQDTVSLAWDIVDVQGNRELYFLPAGKADGPGPAPGQAGSLVDFELMVSGHDPARDADSAYVSAGFGFQFAIFRVAA